MSTEQIINNLIKHKAKVIKKLSANHWHPYFLIKEKFSNKNLDTNFKNTFCAFYIMNGPMGLNDAQKELFFSLLSLQEANLEKILKNLYEIPGYGESRKLFLSFATKLLHTIDNNLPIYDRNIAYILELTNQATGTLEERIKNRIDIYNELKNKFSSLLGNNKIIEILKDIREDLYKSPFAPQFKEKGSLVSDTKLLDSSLWALYDSLQSH